MNSIQQWLTAIASGLILTLAYPRWNVELAVWLWLIPLLGVLWPSQHSSFRIRHSSFHPVP